MNSASAKTKLTFHADADDLDVLHEFTRRNIRTESKNKALFWAVKFALSHPREFSTWCNTLAEYHEAEGVPPLENVQARIRQLAEQLAMEV